MLLSNKKIQFKQGGVTLIETLVGLMVLSIGIGGAASLAVSSFASASATSKQLVAVGLAREAQEAIRNMRDTNWLKSNTLDSDCHDFSDSTADALCFQDWLDDTDGRPYDFKQTGSAEYILDFVPNPSTAGQYWNFRRATGAVASRYRVYVGSGANGQIFTQTATANPSVYWRKIFLDEDVTAPYNQNTGVRVKVTVQVWWQDKGCPAQSDWVAGNKCSLELVSYLTNWKNY